MNRKFLEKLTEAFKGYSARDISLVNGAFSITPHRTNDSSDNEEDWSFKIQSYTNGKLINTHLI